MEDFTPFDYTESTEPPGEIPDPEPPTEPVEPDPIIPDPVEPDVQLPVHVPDMISVQLEDWKTPKY